MSTPDSNDRYISVTVLVEALGTAKSRFVASPVKGVIRQIFGILDVTVDGDNVITSKIDTVAVTGGGFTFPSSGSAAGEMHVATPTALNLVNKGSAIELITDGGGTTGQARFTILIEQTP